MAKSTEKKKPAPAQSSKEWAIDENNLITVTEGNLETEVARLVYDEDDEDQLKPAAINYVDEDMRKRYHTQLIQFLIDEELPFKADVVSIGTGALADRVAAENTPEFNAKVGKPPRQDIYRGDKSPAYVEWLKKNKPATYEQKYGIIGEGVVMKTREVTDHKTGRPVQEQYPVRGTLARRKTHLTEKAEAGTLDEGQEEEDRNPFLTS